MEILLQLSQKNKTPEEPMALKALLRALQPTLLYIKPKAVIPAPYQVRGKLQRQFPSPCPLPTGERVRVRGGFPRIKYPMPSTGQANADRVKPGMTVKTKRFFAHYASVLIYLWITGILIGGCSFGKSQQQDFFKEYRKKMEMQKAAFAKEEEKQVKVPELRPEEHERLGDLHLRQGNMDLAFLQYDKALRMDTSRTCTRYKLGRLFLEKGMYEEAGKEFQEILKLNLNDALAYEGMGRVYFKQANFFEAQKSFQKAIDLKNTLWQSHNFLGIIHDRRGEFEMAISHYRSAIALKSNSSVLHNNLGIALFLKRDYEEAVRAFTEALVLENSNKKIRNNLALALSKLERVEKTFEVSKVGADEASAYPNLGNVHTREEKVQEGVSPEHDMSLW